MNDNKKSVGRPNIDISKESLVSLYEKLQNWESVANTLGVSYLTILRRRKEFGLKTVKKCC